MLFLVDIQLAIYDYNSSVKMLELNIFICVNGSFIVVYDDLKYVRLCVFFLVVNIKY